MRAIAPDLAARVHLARGALALVLAALAFALVGVDTDPDLWGRMAYARDWAATGGLAPRHDPYSYTAPGAPWIDHEWGFNWVAWLTYHALGWPGLRALRVLLFAVTAALCFHEASPRRAASALQPLRALLVGLPLALGFVGPRAQVFTFVFTAWMLFCLRRSWEQGPRWILLAVAPLPLWLNLHGGFLAGLGIAGLWGALRLPGAIRAGDRRTALALVGAGVFCLACLPLSPWGTSFFPFMLRTSTMSRPFVYEWDPPAFLGPQWLMAAALAGLAALQIARGRTRRWPELLVLVATAILAFRHQRHLPFLALAAALCAPPWAPRDEREQTGPDGEEGALSGARLQRVAKLLLGGGAGALLAAAALRLFAPPPAEPAFPVRALSFLQASPLSGGALVDFEWSQYLLFQAWPRFQVAFDGRYEEVYPEEVAARYFAWHYGRPGWRELVDDPSTRLALVRAGSSREGRLARLPGWRREYTDGVATLFVKEARGP